MIIIISIIRKNHPHPALPHQEGGNLKNPSPLVGGDRGGA